MEGEDMNVKVTTEVSEEGVLTQDIEFDEPASMPSKGFIGLAAAGVAALVGAGVWLHRKRKKKKAEKAEVINLEDDEFEEGFDDDLDEPEQEKKPEGKPAEKK